MLRMLVVTGLIVVASAAANAQSIPSATFTQTNVNNYALIAPGGVSTEITVKQTGANNNAVIDQSGERQHRRRRSARQARQQFLHRTERRHQHRGRDAAI